MQVIIPKQRQKHTMNLERIRLQNLDRLQSVVTNRMLDRFAYLCCVIRIRKETSVPPLDGPFMISSIFGPLRSLVSYVCTHDVGHINTSFVCDMCSHEACKHPQHSTNSPV